MRIHIVRHGQTSWNVERRIQGQLDSELDDTGRAQATACGADFRHTALKAVYSSSSVRTRQTTQLILAAHSAGIDDPGSDASDTATQRAEDIVTYRDDLREVRLGIWEGQMWADIEKRFPELVEAHRTASADFVVKGAEKSIEVQERGVKAMESIISAHRHAGPDVNILVVSHGAIMKLILAYYANVALATLHELPTLPNCAHCIIRVGAGQRFVEQIAGIPFNESPWVHAPQQVAEPIEAIDRFRRA